MKKLQYSKKATKIEKRNSKSGVKLKKKQKNIINKKMSFGEIMNRYPEVAEILMKKGMHCLGCGMAMYETLEQGAIMHGINPDKLVEEINRKIS